MPITMTEKIDSRRTVTGENASAELTYTVTGTHDDVAAKAYVETNSPATHDELNRQSIDLEPVFVDAVSQSGIWTATVRYSRIQPIQIGGDGEWSFDTGGGTQHITQSLQTVGKYPAAAPDLKGAIGYDGERVDGVDITVPRYEFSRTFRFPKSSVTMAYWVGLHNLTGCVNNASWSGFAAGEILFLGASSSYRDSDQHVDITFRFAASPNRANIQVGDITGITKAGWDYMWVRYADNVDGDDIVKRPSAVYVERVYRPGNFGTLGIGA